MRLAIKAHMLCTIHARVSASTARRLQSCARTDTLTHVAIEIWIDSRHELDGRALLLAPSCHALTICAYDEHDAQRVHVLSSCHTSKVVAKQLVWRAKLPAHLVTTMRTLEVDLSGDDTAQTLTVKAPHIAPLRVTTTYPLYVRPDEPERVLYASTRRYVTGDGVRDLLFEQRCVHPATWTMQSHRVAEFTHALGVTLCEDFEATITSVSLHHTPQLFLDESRS